MCREAFSRCRSCRWSARPGLQDGSPWSGLLSLNARVADVSGGTWRDPSLAQVFGLRGAIYLVPRSDIAVFTLGAFPADERHAGQVRQHARAVRNLLGGRTMRQRDIIRELPSLGGSRNLRWAGSTGTLLPVWDTVDTVVAAAPVPEMGVADARRELARRFFRYLGPASLADLQWWLDTSRRAAALLVDQLSSELQPVTTTDGARFVTADTAHILEDPPAPRPMLLLPPDDPAINRRTTRPYVSEFVARQLWPKAPPPGAVIADGTIIGSWRRQARLVTIQTFEALDADRRLLASGLAAAFPLPGDGPPETRFLQT